MLRALLPGIRRRLARYVGTGPELDDCTQDVLLSVARGLPAFRGEASIDTWVYRICVRRASASRTARMKQPLSLDREPAVSGGAEGLHTLRRLAEAVDQLPASRRVVFVLHDVEGHTSQELASLLDLPRGTVADRLRRARLELRRILRAWRET